MLKSVAVTYDGKNFVPDENLNLPPGEKVIVNFANPKVWSQYKDMTKDDINAVLDKYCGMGGKMFDSAEEAEEYIRSLRDDRF